MSSNHGNNRRITEDDRRMAHRLAKNGLTQAEIGEAIGVSQQSVSRILADERPVQTVAEPRNSLEFLIFWAGERAERGDYRMDSPYNQQMGAIWRAMYDAEVANGQPPGRTAADNDLMDWSE